MTRSSTSLPAAPAPATSPAFNRPMKFEIELPSCSTARGRPHSLPTNPRNSITTSRSSTSCALQKPAPANGLPMSSYVPAALRRRVASRAHGVCEYCLISEDDSFLGCQVEHVISEKHGGATAAENLAYACVFCNRYKGPDLGSIHPGTGTLVRFFNPRADRWSAHFEIEGPRIKPLTDIGEVTVRILAVNHPDRLLEREQLTAVRRFPSPAAIKYLSTGRP